MKAYVPRIPKMWYFLGLAVFKVELLAAEVGSKFRKKMVERRMSITHNVKSYKKFDEKAQTGKFTVFTM